MHMWFTFGLIIAAVVAYSNDKISMELTSTVIISTLLIFYHFFPIPADVSGGKAMDMDRILQGFANPALLAVLALLVIGQAVVQTGALNSIVGLILTLSRNSAFLSIALTLFVVMVVSAFLNNTPVVVIFIPIIASLAKSLKRSVSSLMIPLSFASILGGMTTLIGSSTNLLASGILHDLGQPRLGFFDFTIPGLVIAAVGFLYIMFIAPRLLPDRESLVKSLIDDESREFVAQIEIDYNSQFVDKKLVDSSLADFPDITIKMIQRGEHAFLPPFEDDLVVRPRDIIVVSANRKDLKELFSDQPYKLLENHNIDAGEEEEPLEDAQISIAEVVVAPASRIIGKNLEQIGFHREHNCVVLGLERHSKVIRSRVTEIRLAAGDVLLIMGRHQDILNLHQSRDVLLMEWSKEEIVSGNKALLTAGIFTGVVGASALGFVPITISSFVGVSAVLITRCINVRQAVRALDMNIMLLIAASIAMGTSLQITGGAAYLAHSVIDLMEGASPHVVMSVMFLFMAVVTNLLSNNASAVLFTPIAVNLAIQLGVDPRLFIFAVIFACNCSFATPIGYQTNLLVMGPGHNKFSDFIRAGVPLVLIVWLTYSFFGPWYFGYYDLDGAEGMLGL